MARVTALTCAPATFWACWAAARRAKAGRRAMVACQPEMAAVTPRLPRTASPTEVAAGLRRIHPEIGGQITVLKNKARLRAATLYATVESARSPVFPPL